MADEIVIPTATLAVDHLIPRDASALLEAFLESHTEGTRRAYASDLKAFARFTGDPTAAAAVERLFHAGRGPANALVLQFRTKMRRARTNEGTGDRRGLAPATINRRLAAIRSCVALARTLGVIDFALDVRSIPLEPYRDTKGPGAQNIRKMLVLLKRSRDRAFVHVLYDRGLRLAEAQQLDLADYDREGGRLRILGKGRSQKEWVTIPEQTMAALDEWIEDRGSQPGPLFIALGCGHRGARLSTSSIYKIIRAAGELIEVPAGTEHNKVRARPHGLRHSAITAALKATNGNVRDVARFSRHKDIRIVQRYDDDRTDLGGAVAIAVAASLDDA